MIKQLILSKLLLLVTTLVHAQCAYKQDVKYWTGLDISCKVIEDIKGSNVFVFYGETLDTNNTDGMGDMEIWIIKNDSCGNRLWKKHIGFEDSVSYDDFRDVIYTPDSCLLILGYGEYTDQGGINSGTIFKVDLDGNVLWKRAYGGKNGLVPSSIVYNPYRQTYIIGGQKELKTTSGLWNRAYIFEIDSVGNQLGQKDIIFNNDSIDANKNSIRISHVGILSDSTIVAVVETWNWGLNHLLKFDNKLNITFDRPLSYPDLKCEGNSIGDNVYFNNNDILMKIGGYDPNDSTSGSWLVKLDNQGNIKQRWLLQKDNEGPYFGGGAFYPTQDSGYIFGTHLHKYDKNLNWQWSKQLATEPFILVLFSIIQLKSGAYAAIGETYNPNVQYEQLIILQTHPNGGYVGLPPSQNPKEGLSLSVYPNPNFSGVFTISNPSLQPLMVDIIDVSGRKILQTTLIGSTFDLSAYPNGLYYIRLTDNNGIVVHRQSIINQHQ